MVEKDSTHVKPFYWARLASQAGSQDLITRVVSSFEGQRCRESKNIRERRQVNRDYYNGLFDTQDGPTASISSLSKKRALTVHAEEV
jgi:hypothetical protein